MISRVRYIYLAFPVTVSAFAVYGPVHLLLLHLFLLPIILRRREDILTPILAVLAACLSFFVVSATLPEKIEPGLATLTLNWSDHVKIDGGKLKGFAKTSTNQTVYAIYPFRSEQEKNLFSEVTMSSFKWTVSGTFREADPPSHQFSFDMKKYMRMYGASAIFEIETLQQVDKQTNILTLLHEQRRKVKQHINYVFPESLVVEAEALLIGDRSGMNEGLASDYRTLGITHLFAISGLHVGLLTYLFRSLLLRISIRRETVDLWLIVLLPLYAVLAGGAPSVWRAVSVTVLVLITSSGRVKIRLDDALAMSAIFFILFQPFVLFQPGFQLSYLAAFALVYSSAILASSKSVLKTSFFVTSISQLALLPVLLFHFHELSISSFVVNLLYVPLYSVIILPANIILLLTTFFLPVIAEGLFYLYVPFREAVGSLTSWIASIPYQLWTPGKPSILLLTIIVAGVFLFFIRWESGGLLRSNISFLLVPALLIHFMPYLDSSLRVTFLDVGQGDCIVIELPYRQAVYVIDTGGTITFGEPNWKTPSKPFEVGRKIVVPYLKGRGITTIDKLILTHADADHVEGADEVLEEMTVKEIHISPGSEVEGMMEEVLRMTAEKKIPVLSIQEGVSWKMGDSAFHYVGSSSGKYVGNDSSLILYMTTSGPSFLLTGDIEESGERRFLGRYGQADFSSLILKAAHHGSRTSSTEELVATLLPELTIFSAGRNSRYGHPHPEVVNRYRDFGLKTMSTAESGSITVTVKGKGYQITSMEDEKTVLHLP